MKLRPSLACVVAFVLSVPPAWSAPRPDTIAVDSTGVPIRCAEHAPRGKAALVASGYHGHEVIPGVVRDDASPFRIEVAVGPGVVRVFLTNPPDDISAPDRELRDDGFAPDRVAGDRIFTSQPIRHLGHAQGARYRGDPHSPEGLLFVDVGNISLHAQDGTVSQFLLGPQVGILRSDIPARAIRRLSEQVSATDHLINVRTEDPQAQRLLRLGTTDVNAVTFPVYQVFQDQFDFLMMFSTSKLEHIPRTSSDNFNAGLHTSVRTSTDGLGFLPTDSSAYYGSNGRLLSINVMDAGQRGVYSANAVHEIAHQWGAYTDASTGLTYASHYSGFSSVGSLLGGFKWIPNGDGSFAVDENEGQNGATSCSPLEKYMAGFAPAHTVPPLYVARTSFVFGDTVPADQVERTVTIDDILALNGPRVPAFSKAQKTFNFGFVAESTSRWLTETEMTFYDILAEHFTKAVPAADPAPHLGFNWAPMTRFFGEGTKWSSRLPAAAEDRAHATSPFLEENGLVVMEAENDSDRSYRGDSLGWEFGSVVPGFAGEGYLSTWDSGIPGATWASSATTRYELRLANAGPRVLWIRRSAPNGAGNSAFVGLNGQLSGEFDNTSSGTGWVWVKHTLPLSPTGRNNILEIRRREDGYRIDRIIVAADPAFVPSGIGPAESRRAVYVTGLTVASGRPAVVAEHGLATGRLQYTDRSYTWTTIPAALKGATFLMTANDDKRGTDAAFVTFEVGRSTRVYVALDERTPVPAWLSSFTPTTDTMKSGGGTYKLYRRTFAAGPVSLGGNGAPNTTPNMYSVVLVPTP